MGSAPLSPGLPNKNLIGRSYSVLQAFLASLSDIEGFMFFCLAMQSFICDLLSVLLLLE